MSTTRFQLVFNGQINDGVNVTSIASEFSRILDIPPEIVGTYFAGRRVVLLDNGTFKAVRDAQFRLKTLGIHCDIKPSKNINLESSQQFSAEVIHELTSGFSYYSSFTSDGNVGLPRKDSDQLHEIARKNTEARAKVPPTSKPEELMIDISQLYETGYKEPSPEKKNIKKAETTTSFQWKG